MNSLIHQNESLEDLNLNHLFIIQKNNAFRFGIDAVLLAWYASGSVKSRYKVADLGTGTGIIPLLLYGRTQVDSIDALEIQDDMADLAQRNVQLNHLEKKIRIHHCDLRNAAHLFNSSSLDLITSNPPYMPLNRGIINPSDTHAIARHEITCCLDDIAIFSKIYLKDKGKLFMIHRADRLNDICFAMRNNGLEIKRLRLVYPFENKNANLVLIEAVKKGKPSVIIERPLFVYKADGSYSDEINAIYGTNGPTKTGSPSCR